MIQRKLFIRLLLIVFFCMPANFSCNSPTINEGSSHTPLSYERELQAALDQVLLADLDHNLGLSAAAKVPGYRTWTGVSGYSYDRFLVTSDMLFNVGSIQKNFEAALVLKLAENGVLSLDDPISKYLPTYPRIDGRITIRQLLNHTSGVFNVFEHPEFPWVGAEVDYSKEWKLEEVIDSFVLDPYGPPGSVQHYSSTNYLLLTEIIKVASGSKIPDGIYLYFLEPLNLVHTYVSMGEQLPGQFPVAHPWVDINRDGILDDLFGISQKWVATLTHPVMYSTAEDLVHWVHSLYYEGRVLSPDSLAEMLDIPETTIHDLEGVAYGLGVADYSNILGTQAMGHAGSSLGYSAAILYLPQYSISVAWLLNTGESPKNLANQIMNNTWSALSEVLIKYEHEMP